MKETKVVIDDFVEDLNYSKIAFEIDRKICYSYLYERLKKDYCNHLYELGRARHHVYMIENCDLNYYENVSTYFEEGYTVVHLEYDIKNNCFYYMKYED